MAVILCAIMLFSVSCTSLDVTPQLPSSPENGETNTPENNGTVTPESGEPAKPEEDGSEFPENGAKKIVSKVINVYSSVDEIEEMTFAHYEDTPEILLIDTETAFGFIFQNLLNTYAEYELEETDTTLKITRDNGAYCVFDFVEDSIYFNDFDLMRAKFFDNMSDVLMSQYVDENGNEIYFHRAYSTEVAGDPVCLELAERDIPLDIYEGRKYVPFQTLNDLFISPFEMNYVYNSKDVFKVSEKGLDPSLEEMYYSVEPSERSKALAEFSVNEVCLVFDLYYGLKDEHGMYSGAKSYLERTGLLDKLLSTDPSVSSTAIASLTLGYLADMHSELLNASPYTGASDIDYNQVEYAISIERFFDYHDTIQAVRAEALADSFLAYYEIGNTAYVSFDSFTLSYDRFTGYDEKSLSTDDTIGLIIYAHKMITREDSPIENVVLDLSCNSGGYVDAGIYVVAWMLGYCDFHLANPITNCFSTSTFTVDVNLDGKFDENDTIADKNLYCLTSKISFSCGNLVPALLKESGKVKLIGDTSGGGTCVVQIVTAADGAIFAISTSYRFSALYNGSYYSIDTGIEPHFYLAKLETFYDRNYLTEYINNLR